MGNKNIANSIRDRLLNIMRKESNVQYMQVLLRYIQERMLYRLSISPYRENFFLKGSALLFAYDKFQARPTKDIDFLGDKISRDKEFIKRVFGEISSIECIEDGITFDYEEIKVEEISLDKEYNGVTVSLIARLGTSVTNFSMDIGFGDIIIPEPHNLDYPLLLDDMPGVNIYAYSLETVVAEKFQTMIDRGILNSRMKDFFDVYTIILSEKLDKDILIDAISTVLKNRGTEYYENHPLFNGELKSDSNKQIQWNSFLKKIKYKQNLSLEVVIETITNFLYPYWQLLKKS